MSDATSPESRALASQAWPSSQAVRAAQAAERNQYAIELLDKIDAYHSSNDRALQDAVLSEIMRRVLATAPEGVRLAGADVLELDELFIPLTEDEALIVSAVIGQSE